ncbi:MAG: hypothetical protein ACI4QS_08455 [Comamonas sp.]
MNQQPNHLSDVNRHPTQGGQQQQQNPNQHQPGQQGQNPGQQQQQNPGQHQPGQQSPNQGQQQQQNPNRQQQGQNQGQRELDQDF